MGYEGTQIYIAHFGNIFQYLFSWGNEIYQQHIVVTVPIWREVANRLGILPLYTLADLEGAEQAMLSTAMDSIDLLKKVQKKREKVAKSDRKCMWQVRVAEDGVPLYKCLYHNVEVPMGEKGVMPRHLGDKKQQWLRSNQRSRN